MQSVVFQSNNVRHKIRTSLPVSSISPNKMGLTMCEKLVFITDIRCPNNKEHRIIYPNCPLHVPPVNCEICYVSDLPST